MSVSREPPSNDRVNGESVDSSNEAPQAATNSKLEKDRQNRIIEETTRNGSDNKSSDETQDANEAGSSQTANSNATTSSTPKCTEREEMEALYLLLNYDNGEVLQHCLELPCDVKSGPILSSLLPVIVSYNSSGNYVPLFRLFNTLPPLLCLALYLSLPKIQKKALQVLSTGHNCANSQFSLEELSTILVFKDTETAKVTCEHYGLSCLEGFVAFKKKDFVDKPIVSNFFSWFKNFLITNGGCRFQEDFVDEPIVSNCVFLGC